MERSRYVKVDVKRAIEKRDSFKCVWCGTKIQEKHHIKEFHLGGENTVKNLITLCSNCHTTIHKGGIDPIELSIRRDEQHLGNRLGGNTSFTVSPPVTLHLGGLKVQKPHGKVIALGDVELLGFTIDSNNQISINCRFYDKSGKLIFWMYNNYYCCTADFYISNREDEIKIASDNEEQFVHIKKMTENSISILYSTFVNGHPFISNKSSGVVIGSVNISGGGSFVIDDPSVTIIQLIE